MRIQKAEEYEWCIKGETEGKRVDRAVGISG